MNNTIFRHLLFWVVVMAFLIIYFGRVEGDYSQSLFFVSFLMPVAVGTSYFFNYFLVPKYLLTQRYRIFTLYLVYTIVITTYLQMLVILLSFVLLAQYQFGKMNPLTVDVFSLSITIYAIVLLLAFIRILRSYQQVKNQKDQMLDQIQRNDRKFITVISDRKQVPIYFDTLICIESLADYVQIHTTDGTIITKEKISKLEIELPDQFVRVHRSFIINKIFIKTFTSESVNLHDREIPVSRTYKKRLTDG